MQLIPSLWNEHSEHVREDLPATLGKAMEILGLPEKSSIAKVLEALTEGRTQ